MDVSNQNDLRRKLDQAERALEKSERLGVASRYAGAIMHEVNNPLEAMTNSRLSHQDPAVGPR